MLSKKLLSPSQQAQLRITYYGKGVAALIVEFGCSTQTMYNTLEHLGIQSRYAVKISWDGGEKVVRYSTSTRNQAMNRAKADYDELIRSKNARIHCTHEGMV